MGTARLAEAVRTYADRSRHRASSLRARPKSTALAIPASIRCAKRSICGRAIRTAPAKPRPKLSCWARRAASELDVVIARGFNHIGPGQKEHFVVASLAAQLARIAAGGPPQLFVGNLDAARDFLDVRDVVAAYVALARHGERGEVYNVCSGSAVTIRDVLRELIAIARVPVEVREDPARDCDRATSRSRSEIPRSCARAPVGRRRFRCPARCATFTHASHACAHDIRRPSSSRTAGFC